MITGIDIDKIKKDAEEIMKNYSKAPKKNFTLILSNEQVVSTPVAAFYHAYKHNTSGKTIIVREIPSLPDKHYEVSMTVEEVTDIEIKDV